MKKFLNNKKNINKSYSMKHKQQISKYLNPKIKKQLITIKLKKFF